MYQSNNEARCTFSKLSLVRIQKSLILFNLDYANVGSSKTGNNRFDIKIEAV